MISYSIEFWRLSLVLVTFVFPWLILRWLGLTMGKTIVLAVVRMVLQLLAVGIYLRYLFLWDHWALNIAWILVMILATNQNIIKRANLLQKEYFLILLPAYLVTILLALGTAVWVIPWSFLMKAQYLIPLLGMIMGNLLRSNISGLQTFQRDLLTRQGEMDFMQACGASPFQTVRPLLRDAMDVALSPQIAMLGTMGLVSIPGMMTGQILGGVSPWEAARYQILVMVLVFLTSTSSSFLSLLLFWRRRKFVENGF